MFVDISDYLGRLAGLMGPPSPAGMRTGLAVFLTAMAVKAMDDLVDDAHRMEGETGAPRVASYALLFLAVGAALDPGPAVTLFLSAYALGMIGSPLARLPSGLPSWAESLAAVGLGAVTMGPLEVAGSLVLLSAVQVLDDCRDVKRDFAENRTNIAAVAGGPLSVVLAGLLFLGAALISPAKALSGLVAGLALTGGTGASLGPMLSRSMVHRAGSPPDDRARRRDSPGLAAVALMTSLAGGLASGMGATPKLAEGVAASNWLTALAAFSIAAAVGIGFVAAYRLGRGARRRREGDGERALRELLSRADRYDQG